ncbi:MAG: helix-turn-helix domain-containing protein [Armatimonadota bacterium]
MAIEQSDNNQKNRVVKLTKRETQVLSLVLEGKSSREVAFALFCSKRTVDYHLTKIYEKLEVSNRVQAMRRAALLGLIEVGQPERTAV